LDNLKTSKDEEEIFRIRKIVENVKRVAEYASDIGEIVLNMNIEKILKKPKGVGKLWTVDGRFKDGVKM